VSLFINAETAQIDAAKAQGASNRDSYRPLRDTAGEQQQAELGRICAAVDYGNRIGLKVNAGHA